MEDAIMEDFAPLSLLSEDEQDSLDEVFRDSNGLDGLEGVEYQLAQKRMVMVQEDDFDTYLRTLTQQSQSWKVQLY